MNMYLKAGLVYEAMFNELEALILPGIKILKINTLFNKLLKKYRGKVIDGTIPLSININNRIYHSPIDSSLIKVGDVVTIDLCCEIGGAIIDGAKTIEIVTKDFISFLDVSREAVLKGVEKVEKGCNISEIIQGIDTFVGLNGYYLYPDGIGHGVGPGLHQRPYLSMNFYDDFKYVFKPGDVFTIEPIIFLQKDRVIEDSTGAGYIPGGNISSQFEVTVLINEDSSPIIINKALIK